MRIDEFFERQPEPKFIDYLNSPLHESGPENFAKAVADPGEIAVKGAYIASCADEWQDSIRTATDDFQKFLSSSNSLGSSYPISIMSVTGFDEEDYKISVSDTECVIYASDTEGARRAVYYLEEEMIKREGAFLAIGEIVRTSHIKRRITRGFFSPTNRAPKWGDELLDEIDYYPDNYLNRLAHNGTNGLWIYTSFAQLTSSPYIPGKDENCEKRMAKLRGIVEKCKKYGIKVYLFAIEPAALPLDAYDGREDMLGAIYDAAAGKPKRTLCPRSERTRAHVIYCLEHIYSAIPDLKGYITIPAGERPTTCSSVGTYHTCSRCGRYSRGENLAYSIDLIKEGLRRAATGAELISWTYGHRYWNDDDITEYIDKTPDDVILMQNFEDRGVDVQLDKPRIAWDYWLSYVGPSDMFSLSARSAKKHGNTMYAKMQVCSSHEIATVPYISVPGILFDKYRTAHDLGIGGIMECWYFGNYPSLMNRASTELSYLDTFSDKRAFLLELAARLYGRSRAEGIANAWQTFEEGYKNYPTNVMFSYYGPMHDGIVWELSAIPKNRPLPRSWQLLDVPDGDRIGECLFKGHTLDEAITLCELLYTSWEQGLSCLPLPDNDEHVLCTKATGLLFKSGTNILKFYKLRENLGNCTGDSSSIVREMEKIVRAEVANSKQMIELCRMDARIGYHSESEGYKFFPEKLSSRIEKLEKLFDTDFPEIKHRLSDGRAPLGCYYAEGEDFYPLSACRDNLKWVSLDEVRTFAAYVSGDEIVILIRCYPDDTFFVCFEFELFHPESAVVYSPKAHSSAHGEVSEICGAGLSLCASVLSHQSIWGDSIADELSNYRIDSTFGDSRAEHVLHVKIPSGKWDRKRAIKLKLKINDLSWKADPDPTITLGKADLSPGDFGTLLPI